MMKLDKKPQTVKTGGEVGVKSEKVRKLGGEKVKSNEPMKK
jgi:hypothetical protein